MTDIVHHLRRLSLHKHDDHTVGDAGADEIERLERKIDLKNAVITQMHADLAALRACRQLVNDLLAPEMFGFAVNAEIRDAARRALGIPPVETKPRPMPSFNESDARRDALNWPRGSLGEEVETDGGAA